MAASPVSDTEKARHRSTISVATKVEIIRAVEAGEKQVDVAFKHSFCDLRQQT